MNELESAILDVMRGHPDGMSTMDIINGLDEMDARPTCVNYHSRVNKTLNSLRKYGFIDRTTRRMCVDSRRSAYYWRIHRTDSKVWTSDLLTSIKGETTIQQKERVERLLEMKREQEIWDNGE